MRCAASALALTALSACTVGPTYRAPPTMPAYAARGSGCVRAGGLGQVETPSLAPWWRTLGDPILDDVMARALEHSPTVALARARVGQARAEMRLQTAGAAPVVRAGVAAAHGGAPGRPAALFEPEGADEPDSTDLFAAGFDALWEIDLFGGRRRMVESARAGAGRGGRRAGGRAPKSHRRGGAQLCRPPQRPPAPAGAGAPTRRGPDAGGRAEPPAGRRGQGLLDGT